MDRKGPKDDSDSKERKIRLSREAKVPRNYVEPASPGSPEEHELRPRPKQEQFGGQEQKQGTEAKKLFKPRRDQSNGVRVAPLPGQPVHPRGMDTRHPRIENTRGVNLDRAPAADQHLHNLKSFYQSAKNEEEELEKLLEQAKKRTMKMKTDYNDAVMASVNLERLLLIDDEPCPSPSPLMYDNRASPSPSPSDHSSPSQFNSVSLERMNELTAERDGLKLDLKRRTAAASQMEKTVKKLTEENQKLKEEVTELTTNIETLESENNHQANQILTLERLTREKGF